jgi:hypothetical protein
VSRLAYEAWNPGADALSMVHTANVICQEYAEQGYDLTLRQLYYQFVARDLLPNNLRSYKRLGDYVNRARMAGLMDWSFIVDRTRNLRSTSHWADPASVIQAAADSYRIDKWATQDVRVEVWVEKEALAGIVERSADEHDVAWFACRGYVSQSEQWAAGQRFLRYLQAGQRVVILHLGDHDPSGIDMTRDVRDRLTTFVMHDWLRHHRADLGSEAVSYSQILRHMVLEGVPLHADQMPIEVRRIALNMDQVEEYDPPPNPAKLTDSRAEKYIAEYGDESWELDALDPTVLAGLITEHIAGIRDDQLYDALADRELGELESLAVIAEQYDQIASQFGGA